jgi:hypothetical protein
MVVYKVFYKNYELKKGEFVGLLIERRKDLRGKTRLESGLRWARLTFGRRVKDERAVFIVPDELTPGNDTEWLMEKGVFTRLDLLGMVKPVDQEIKKKREERIKHISGG